jgi:methyl-accepting chemotaxis protein
MQHSDTTKPVAHPSRRNRRRKYFINPAFQWKYTLAIATGVFLSASFMGVVLFGILHQQARLKVLYPGTTNVWENAYFIFIFALAFSMVVVTGLGAWGVVVTHRISGPLFVLQRQFARLAEGCFPRRRPLRKKDEFKELYESFWQAVDSLKANKQAELAKLTEILNIARSAAGDGNGAPDNALETVAAQIEELRAQAAEALGGRADSPPAAPLPSTGPREHDALVVAGPKA